MESVHYAILCHAKAGKGSALKALPFFEDFLKNKQITYEVFNEQLPLTLTGFSCFVVMGGDGSLNFVINHFKRIPIPIALIRCGTGNDYNTLHVGSASLEQQFEIACGTQTIETDAGICNGKLFINGVGIGFDGWIVKRNLGKHVFNGHAAYLSTILSLLLFYKERVIEVEIDQTKMIADIFMISIAKGKTYGGGFRVAPLSNLSDGFFDFIVVKKISRLNRFRYLPAIEKGRHLHLPFVYFQKAKQINIKSTFLLQAHLDGEWLESKEFNIEILPAAFQIKSILKN